MTYKKRIYSGICKCGHDINVHHLGMVANKEYSNQTGENYIGQECCFYGFNEMGGLDEKGNVHCFQYIDKDDPDVQE